MRPTVLCFIGNYLPGYKAGGILRTLENTVEHLSPYIDFWIVTRDRDLGDTVPYPNVTLNSWQKVGNSMVYYLTPELSTVRGIRDVLSSTRHDVLYLNSLFDPLSIFALVNHRLRRVPRKPLILSPRGEFAWASLRQKFLKKIVYFRLSRALGLYNDVLWHASSQFEAEEISRFMGLEENSIHVALDLPSKSLLASQDKIELPDSAVGNALRVVFLSRIAREKNIDYALKILSRVKANVIFDIYGPVENREYWSECQELFGKLPDNVKVTYRGVNREPVKLFGSYELFLFPTGGENYGHVISESLTAGTPVLTSNKTPWRKLQEDSLGWDLPLEEPDSFVSVIENYATLNATERENNRNLIRNNIKKRLSDPAVLEANRSLFTKLLPISQHNESK